MTEKGIYSLWIAARALSRRSLEISLMLCANLTCFVAWSRISFTVSPRAINWQLIPPRSLHLRTFSMLNTSLNTKIAADSSKYKVFSSWCSDKFSRKLLMVFAFPVKQKQRWGREVRQGEGERGERRERVVKDIKFQGRLFSRVRSSEGRCLYLPWQCGRFPTREKLILNGYDPLLIWPRPVIEKFCRSLGPSSIGCRKVL